MKKLKGKHYYALLCDGGTKTDWVICGIFASKKEASEITKDLKECPAKHKVVRCSVVISY